MPHEFFPEGQKLKNKYYLQILRRLLDTINSKRPEKWSSRDWQIHHDNAPAHSSQLVQNFVAKHEIPHVQQPPYSANIAQCDFSSFPEIKIHLKGRRFDDAETIKRNTTQQLQSISKTDFHKCFEQRKSRWNRCIKSQACYFEGDQSTIVVSLLL